MHCHGWERTGDGKQGHPGTASEVGNLPTSLQSLDHSLERGKDPGDKREARPRSEHLLGPVRALGTLSVVTKAPPGPKRLGKVVDEGRVGRWAERTRGVHQAAVTVGKHGDTSRRELEQIGLRPVDQPSSSHRPEPLEHPTFVQAAPVGELPSRDRTAPPEFGEEPQTGAEVDEQ